MPSGSAPLKQATPHPADGYLCLTSPAELIILTSFHLLNFLIFIQTYHFLEWRRFPRLTAYAINLAPSGKSWAIFFLSKSLADRENNAKCDNGEQISALTIQRAGAGASRHASRYGYPPEQIFRTSRSREIRVWPLHQKSWQLLNERESSFKNCN